MGTPDFAVPSLRALVEAGHEIATVVTGADKPRGRGRQVTPTAVKAAALELGLDPIWQPDSLRDPAFVAQIVEAAADLIVVVAFRILPPEVYSAPRLGSINLHGSLLPAYRGAAPIHRAVMAGATETGITTFLLDRSVDTGRTLGFRRTPVGPDETTGDVHDRLAILGAELVVHTVAALEHGTAQPQPQNDALATAAPKLTKADLPVDWSRPAAEIHNHVRGLSPFPAATTEAAGETWKLYRTALVEQPRPGVPGEVLVASGDDLIVATGHGGAVRLVEIQREGRRRMSAGELLRGHDVAVGTVLGRNED